MPVRLLSTWWLSYWLWTPGTAGTPSFLYPSVPHSPIPTDNISFVVPSSWILDSGPYTLPV